MKRATRVLVSAAALLVSGLAAWVWLAGDSASPATDARPVLYWTDPMVPGYRSDKPGKSPFMDMELVPVYAEDAAPAGAPAVTVSSAVVQKLAVRTAVIRREAARHQLTASGYLFRDSGTFTVIADVFERDTRWLRPGLAAEVRIAGLPGTRFTAHVAQVESDQDIGGGSIRLRLRLQQADARLRPNMAAEVTVSASAAARLLVPREALIRSAQRTVLIRILDDGRFQPVDVETGEEFGEQVEIRGGLREGERIVTSGQFLIDSESSVRESLKRMDAAPADHAH